MLSRYVKKILQDYFINFSQNLFQIFLDISEIPPGISFRIFSSIFFFENYFGFFSKSFEDFSKKISQNSITNSFFRIFFRKFLQRFISRNWPMKILQNFQTSEKFRMNFLSNMNYVFGEMFSSIPGDFYFKKCAKYGVYNLSEQKF